jgi:hypothetical protein
VKLIEMSFEGWPARQAWRDELEKVKDTHDMNPIPAYDINHQLITSKHYERALIGAMVEVHFTLIHYLIGKKGSTLVADLRELIVLRAPQQQIPPQSPSKRQLLSGPSSSPKKPRV